MLWLLTLPFRIVFGLVFAIVGTMLAVVFFPLALLLWLPFALLRGAFKVVGALLLVLAFGVGGILLLAAVLLPLLPLLLLIGGCWLVYRVTRPRPIVVG
jgi:hypothetical protein